MFKVRQIALFCQAWSLVRKASVVSRWRLNHQSPQHAALAPSRIEPARHKRVGETDKAVFVTRDMVTIDQGSQ